MSQKITPFIWYDNNAHEAVELYMSLFSGGKIISKIPGQEGKPPMGITFEIEGQRYIAFNGGPSHPFNDTVSLYVDCEDQAEIDKLWSGLIANGGSPIQCGWLKDRFGLRWQIVPRVFMSLMNSPDPKKSKAVFQAMMKMVKFDIAGLQRAHDEA